MLVLQHQAFPCLVLSDMACRHHFSSVFRPWPTAKGERLHRGLIYSFTLVSDSSINDKCRVLPAALCPWRQGAGTGFGDTVRSVSKLPTTAPLDCTRQPSTRTQCCYAHGKLARNPSLTCLSPLHSPLHRPSSRLGMMTGPYLLTPPYDPSPCTMKSAARLNLPPPCAMSVRPYVPCTTSGS